MEEEEEDGVRCNGDDTPLLRFTRGEVTFVVAFRGVVVEPVVGDRD